MVFHMTGLAILDPLPSDPEYHCRFCTVSDLCSNEELNAHEASKHNVCPVCKKWYSSWDDLKTHCRQTKCAMVCEGCGHRGALHHNNEYFERHKQTHNVCEECEKHFETPSNLTHHKLTHRTPDYECYGCTRTFTTYSGMIIHLESGTCTSGIDIHDLGKSAAMCFQWKKYIITNWVHARLLEEEDLWPLIDEYGDAEEIECFKCPRCDIYFTKLSGLFMHVESESCSQTLGDGAIGKLRWLSNRHS
ncbi:hypothetical protein HBI34_082480 [Parastagonospora nodorum]|nr:hypothetical protein HBI34_082480 [Parastagonospora nodorum]